MGRGQVREKGFTLLELIVVLFILGLAAGVVVPAVARSTDTVRTRTNVVGLSALLRHTREQAIVLRKAHTVTIDVVEHAVKVGVADTIVRRRAIPANWSIEANPPNALTLRFDPQGTTSGGDYRISAGSTVYRITVDPITGRVRNTRE